MEKMRMETLDMVSENIKKIENLFPNCITETIDENGNPRKAINFELLRQMLSKDVLEGDEAYEFTWVGKKASIVEANKPIRKTLRPCPEESVNWDSTENLYIEGDNLEVLKLLQESYLGKVKLIYIDPPYNTGNDFIYRDDYAMTAEEYEEQSGLYDEETGERLFKNTDSNGRFHSDWCSMIYSRLMIARNLLAEDGVIFISIDDNEVENLKKICDEIFGAKNFVNCIAVKMSEASGVKMNHAKTRFPKLKEYLLFYKRENFTQFITIDKYKIEEWDKENNIFLANFTKENRSILQELEEKEINDEADVVLANKILKEVKMVSLSEKLKELRKDDKAIKEWLFENSYRIIKTAGSSSLAKLVKSKPRIFGQDIAAAVSNKGVLFFYITDFNTETKQPRLQVIFADSNIYKNPCDFWQDIKTTGAIAEEGGVNYNNGKKPLKLLNRIIKMTTTKDDLVLDFFAGSSTTAHSVFEMNRETNGKRKFIMVQINEDLDESLAKADGNTKKTIEETISFLDEIEKPHILSELGKERIRRAGVKIKEENPLTTIDLDVGFRVFKLADSNMNDVYYSANEYKQDMISLLESNIKEDRTDLDLLFGCLLEWGLPLSLPYRSEEIEGCRVHTYNENDLVACFDENVPEMVVREIAKRQPLRVVFRDSSFADSPSKINVGEIFKMLAPNTSVKVI